MTMEPRVIRTLKKTFNEDHFTKEAEHRKQVSDDILDIIYSKVMSKHLIDENDKSDVAKENK